MQDQRVIDHRQLGVDLFNETWRLIESREDDTLMIDCAHASAYHWAVARECKPENGARSAWQISRAYTVAGRASEALFHAERCFQLCERYGLGDWDLAYAYEALARASAVAGGAAATGEWRARARQAGDAIGDPEDREHFDEDFATL